MKILKFILAISLSSYYPMPVHANDPYMDGARDAVAQQIKNADHFAETLVVQSLYQTMDNLLGTVKEMKGQLATIDKVRAQMEQLESEMVSFAKLDVQSAGSQKEHMIRAIKSYQDQFRRLVDLSFTPSAVATLHAQMPQLMQMIVSEYETTCRMGKANVDFSAALPSTPPPPEYKNLHEIYVSNTGKDTRGEYHSINYGHKDREAAMGYAAQTAGYSFLIYSTFGASMGAGLATATLAMGGVGLAVVVILAAISYFSGSAKAYKMMSKYVNAEVYKHANVPRSQYIARKFREGCISQVQILQDVAKLLKTYNSGPDGQNKIKAQLEEQSAGLSAVADQLDQANLARCRLKLAAEYEKTKVLENQLCKIELDGKGKAVTEADQALLDKLDKERFYERHMGKYVTHAIGKALTVDSETLSSTLQSISFEHLYVAQARAFSRLMAIVNSYQLVLNTTDPSRSEIIKELGLTEQYESLRGALTDLVAAAIKMIFGRMARADYLAQSRSFETQLARFMTENPGVIAGFDLKNRFHALTRLIMKE